ncbi:MAG: T9SS type A sorting domain-containing protein [Flavobacterium sp.]|nr:T9SS type A sorting domain-containing protein [Flavobacterium sp.]
MYPNPTKNEVTIQYNALTNPQLEVIDLNGRVLLKQTLNNTNNTLNIASLPSGIYLFKINSKEGLAISRVIKN